MTIITQINYELQGLQDGSTQNSSVAALLRVNAATPKYLLHKSIIAQHEISKQGSASCKTRAEVRGGGKKPWKQKGTGRARTGSTNSPLWRGGGVTFGPKPKTSRKKINLKEKQLALTTALYCVSNRLSIVKNSFFQMDRPNTKELLTHLNKIKGLSYVKRVLCIIPKVEKNLILSMRNIPNIEVAYPNTLSVRKLLIANQILTTEEALSHIIKLPNFS